MLPHHNIQPDLTQPDEEIRPLLYAVVDTLADIKGLIPDRTL